MNIMKIMKIIFKKIKKYEQKQFPKTAYKNNLKIKYFE